MTAALLLSLAAVHLMAAISPGPAFVVILRVAAAEGRGNALAVAAGFGLGAGLWAAAALLGLTLLFEMLPAALLALKWIGAGFLLLLGILMWRHADAPPPAGPDGPGARAGGRGRAFRIGLLTQLANPKAALFFGAVFVGLLSPGLGPSGVALVLTSVLAVEFAWYGVVALTLSRPSARAAYARAKRWVDRAFGTLLALFGARIALT